MPRLSFSTRIGLIVVASVALVWLGGVSLFYLSQARGNGAATPVPAQIAAIVDLVEHTPRERQRSVLDAVTSDRLLVRLEDGDQVGPSSPRPLIRLGGRAVEAYLAELGGRPMSVKRPEATDRQKPLSMITPGTLEFRVGLNTAQTLVIDTRNTLLVTFFGLPVGFGAGLLGTFIALFALSVLHRETRPLTRLAADVDGIDPNRMNEALPEPKGGAPEIAALVVAFNRLQTRLAHLMRARMAMLGGISHDVRTFATRLRLRVDAIPDAAQRQRAVADIDDMIRLLDDALLASRAGVGEGVDELVEVDEVVRDDVVDRIAHGASITVRVAQGGADTTILGDRLAVRRVVANLVDNAIRYGSVVHVGLGRVDALVVLTVDDDGPGIPPDRRRLMLEPFTRLDASRDRKTGGAGLGLAVVRTLVEAQGGSIVISDAPEGGARLTVRWPRFVA